MQGNNNEFQVGNWVLYLPERCYCTIKSLSPELILQGIGHNYTTTTDYIKEIEITEDKLQVLGFEVDYPIFIKRFDDEISVGLIMFPTGVHTVYENAEEFCKVQFIHQVQNAFYRITGEMLKGNLYGVREG